MFRLFINGTIIQHIKEETNRYAESPQSKDIVVMKSWQMVTMNRFFLILLHKGCLHKTFISDYWTREEFCASKFASKILTCDRFKVVLLMLYLSENRICYYAPIDEPVMILCIKFVLFKNIDEENSKG